MNDDEKLLPHNLTNEEIAALAVALCHMPIRAFRRFADSEAEALLMKQAAEKLGDALVAAIE
jgi:hypothetical protein